MNRHSPPAGTSSPYITTSGFAALRREEKEIWKKRMEVTRALAAAAAEGDRSENAEYIYRKKQLAEIDRRIHYLQKRLPTLNVVSEVGDPSRVFFSAWVTLEKELDENRGGEVAGEIEYRIVGGDEIDSDSSKGYISVDSPLAKAMLGKRVDDEVTLERGGERRIFSIRKIRYR